ncbi:MAG TPA: hypothetical protein VLW50_05000 [Streptosporangiaceae bacterium]|nr:hypothetical protein [Streptosporangiaceae bacterium]
MSLVLRRPAAAFLLAGLALAGCGSGPRTAATASRSYPEAAKSANQIVADARQATLGVTTFHVAGAIRQAKQGFSVDLHFDGTSGAYGSVTYAGIPFQVVRIGSAMYFKAPATFYTKTGSPSRVASMAAGRWIKASGAGSGIGRFASLTSGAQFFGGMLGSAASAGMVKVPGVQLIGGIPAVALADPHDGSRLYVALQGPALPVRIDGPGDSGSMNIADYGKPVMLVAPPAVKLSGVKV